MSSPRIVHINSVDQLRAAASIWDDLWRRSEVIRPTARAELLAQWVEQFAPRSGLRALVVEDEGKWVAALPLVRIVVRRVLSAGGICGRTWIPGGGLLLDANARTDAVLDALVAATRELPWQLLWLNEVALDATRWKAFRQAVARAGMACDVNEESQNGLLEIDHDWEACQKKWSKKHRQKMRHCIRLASEANVQFRMLSPLEPEEVDEWMRRAFEIEDRSWKGGVGSSVFQRGQFQFVVRQARQLAEWRQLELTFLEADGHPIAFSYGFNAKGVYQVCKIGYDPEYAALTPGQLLFYHLLERLHGEPECRAIDFFGKLSHAISRWKPASYPIGRVVVAPRRVLGRTALYAYRHWWPRIRRVARSS